MLLAQGEFHCLARPANAQTRRASSRQRRLSKDSA